MLFQLVTAFCAVAHGASSRFDEISKVATINIRLSPFISLTSLSRYRGPCDPETPRLQRQSFWAPFRIRFESQGKPLIAQKMTAHLQKPGPDVIRFASEKPYAGHKAGSRCPPLWRV